MINGVFKGINLSNWSGKQVTVKVKNNVFEMYDYVWTIKPGYTDQWGTYGSVSCPDGIEFSIITDAADVARGLVAAAVAKIANEV